MDQEEVDTDSLADVTKDLVNPTLREHNDKGVRALVACCIADLLRLYAPDAPYNDRELRVRRRRSCNCFPPRYCHDTKFGFHIRLT